MISYMYVSQVREKQMAMLKKNCLPVYNTCTCGSFTFFMYIATQGSGEGKHSSQSI